MGISEAGEENILCPPWAGRQMGEVSCGRGRGGQGSLVPDVGRCSWLRYAHYTTLLRNFDFVLNAGEKLPKEHAHGEVCGRGQVMGRVNLRFQQWVTSVLWEIDEEGAWRRPSQEPAVGSHPILPTLVPAPLQRTLYRFLSILPPTNPTTVLHFAHHHPHLRPACRHMSTQQAPMVSQA